MPLIVLELISPLYGVLGAMAVSRFSGKRGPGTGPMMAAGALIAAMAWQMAPGLAAVATLLGWTLLALALIDVLAYRLPDVFTLFLVAAGLVAPGATVSAWERIVGAGLGFLVLVGVEQLYLRLRRRSGMGLGDAKLLAAAGAWLGWTRLPEVLLLASAGGLVWVAVRVLTKGRAELGRAVPYGAPLCAALWLSWLLG